MERNRNKLKIMIEIDKLTDIGNVIWDTIIKHNNGDIEYQTQDGEHHLLRDNKLIASGNYISTFDDGSYEYTDKYGEVYKVSSNGDWKLIREEDEKYIISYFNKDGKLINERVIE